MTNLMCFGLIVLNIFIKSNTNRNADVYRCIFILTKLHYIHTFTTFNVHF